MNRYRPYYLSRGYFIYIQDEWLVLSANEDYWIIYANKPSFLNVGFEKYGEYYKRYLPYGHSYNFSAFHKYIYCYYQGGKYTPNRVVIEDKIILFPDLDTQVYILGFRDKGDHYIEIPYSEFLEEVTDIWEDRTPIEGFKFDVEPIVYLKRKGVWFVDHEKLVDEVDE